MERLHWKGLTRLNYHKTTYRGRDRWTWRCFAGRKLVGRSMRAFRTIDAARENALAVSSILKLGRGDEMPAMRGGYGRS